MSIFDAYIPQPMRFYDKVEKQNRYKSQCKQAGAVDANPAKLIQPFQALLPFIIIREPSIANTMVRFYLVNEETGNEYELNTALVEIFTTEARDYMVYSGGEIWGSDPPLPCGYYTAVVQDGANTFYSELVWIPPFIPSNVQNDDFTMPCNLQIRWRNSCNFAKIPYTDFPYFEFLYIFDPQAEVMEREGRLTREGKENGDRDPVYSFQKEASVYAIETGLIPDCVLDGLRAMQMHDDITLYLKNSMGSGEIKNVTLTQKWEFDSCYANAQVRFETTSLIKTGCCEDLEGTPIQACLEACLNAYLDPGTGYVIGNKYLSADGRIKEYQADGSFVYFGCSSGIAHVLDDDLDYVYDPVTGQWYLLPSIISADDDGTGTRTYIIKAAGPPGTNGALIIFGAETPVVMTAEEWKEEGYAVQRDCCEDLSVEIAFSLNDCDYGSASVVIPPAGDAEWTTEVIDLSAIGLNSRWSTIRYDGVDHTIPTGPAVFLYGGAFNPEIISKLNSLGIGEWSYALEGNDLTLTVCTDDEIEIENIIIADLDNEENLTFTFTQTMCAEFFGMEMREDNGDELREDGGIELREE